MSKKRVFNPIALLVIALAVLALPATATAMSCNGQYFLCMLEHGGSTFCVHEYVACLAEAIRAF